MSTINVTVSSLS